MNRSRPVEGDAVERVRPYAALAGGYDLVMTHINYDEWALYIHGLLVRHGNKVRRVLELGCGTAAIGIELFNYADYVYTGLDRSVEMLEVARRKANRLGIGATWIEADYAGFTTQEPFDAVLLLYDGLNYAPNLATVSRLSARAFEAVRPGGLFVVDQSTPANSENNTMLFQEDGGDETFGYSRRSRYEAETRIHRTTFRIRAQGRTYQEEHVQYAYTAAEVGACLEGAGFEIVASYDGFTVGPAREDSERIQWVARR